MRGVTDNGIPRAVLFALRDHARHMGGRTRLGGYGWDEDAGEMGLDPDTEDYARAVLEDWYDVVAIAGRTVVLRGRYADTVLIVRKIEVGWLVETWPDESSAYLTRSGGLEVVS